MIAIVDYGMANLRSVERALLRAGGDPCITSEPELVGNADSVVLPGVGAFCACATNLKDSGLEEAVKSAMDSGRPFLGICVGMQMLFEESTEMGVTPGLNRFDGRVIRFYENSVAPPNIKIPHIGWNILQPARESRLLKGVPSDSQVYFVHSYYAVPSDSQLVSATSDHGETFCCAIERENISATQFHPEKSGSVGLQILQNFVNWRS